MAASSALLPALCVHIVSSPPAPPELELEPLEQAAMERGSAAASRPTATRLVVGVSFIGSSGVGRSSATAKTFQHRTVDLGQRPAQGFAKSFSPAETSPRPAYRGVRSRQGTHGG